MRPTLSILGLYNYDNTIFDTFSLPDGVKLLYVMDGIFREAGELNTAFPDVTVFKQMISVWSARKLPVWERLYKTTTL